MLEGWMFGLAALGAMLAGISKGGFGGSLGFAGSAILAVVVEPGVALALMLPVLMAIDMAAVRAYWGRWDKPSAGAILTGAVPGLVLGAVLFSVISADSIRVLIGLVAVGFPLFRIALARGWIAPRPTGFDRRKGWIAGMGVGFTSFVAHAGGPPFAVFMLGQGGIDKTRYHATSVIVFWVVNAMKAALYTMLGLFSWQLLGWSAALIPFAMIGTLIGVKAHKLIPERLFFMVAYTALMLTGMKLLWDGVM
ncbi:sulfite exporter TauE/SafE family protein [Roseicyclus sp.]|uniref:sulfite exporter TauE/SafE family protein n=1 Tax=Roseicyclus sp. TaxID=1914329 RepID=UPI00345BED75